MDCNEMIGPPLHLNRRLVKKIPMRVTLYAINGLSRFGTARVLAHLLGPSCAARRRAIGHGSLASSTRRCTQSCSTLVRSSSSRRLQATPTARTTVALTTHQMHSIHICHAHQGPSRCSWPRVLLAPRPLITTHQMHRMSV